MTFLSLGLPPGLGHSRAGTFSVNAFLTHVDVTAIRLSRD